MSATSVAVLVAVFVLLAVASERFHGVADEFFRHYVLNVLRYAWLYLLIWLSYELIENRDAGAAVQDIVASHPHLIKLTIAGVALFLVVMMASNRLRRRANELWEHYVINALRYGWPYAAIVAAYTVISDGSAFAFARRIAVAAG